MSQTETIIVLDETEYKWVHTGCFCFSHCGQDQLFVDGEPCGTFDNAELCGFIDALIKRAGVEAHTSAPEGK